MNLDLGSQTNFANQFPKLNLQSKFINRYSKSHKLNLQSKI